MIDSDRAKTLIEIFRKDAHIFGQGIETSVFTLTDMLRAAAYLNLLISPFFLKINWRRELLQHLPRRQRLPKCSIWCLEPQEQVGEKRDAEGETPRENRENKQQWEREKGETKSKWEWEEWKRTLAWEVPSSVSASLRCVQSRVSRAEEGKEGWGSGCQVCLSFYPSAPTSAFLLQLLLARITNHSLQRLLVTSSFPLITFGDAKLVN